MKKLPRSIKGMWMRGGTSKGIFLDGNMLKEITCDNREMMNRIILNIMGSPDVYN